MLVSDSPVLITLSYNALMCDLRAWIRLGYDFRLGRLKCLYGSATRSEEYVIRYDYLNFFWMRSMKYSASSVRIPL